MDTNKGLHKKLDKRNVPLSTFYFIIALTALGLGLSNDIMSNYFKDVYNVSTLQRGFIEFPRELPGILSTFIIAGLSFISDIKISIVAQVLSVIGIAALGFFTPPFAIMLIFIFINSMGMHLFFPLQDSIGLSLIKDNKVGKKMGQFKGLSTAFTMIASVIVFIGFRFGFFSFNTKIKWVFILCASIFLIVIILLVVLEHYNKDVDTDNKEKVKKTKFIIRKEYKYYYGLVIMFGVQKQMMMVYGPWVLIELLSKKADTIALLGIIGSFIGMFFIPALGRWLDRFGIKKLLYADALSYIGVYILYGLLCIGFMSKTFSTFGIPVLLAYLIFIIDRMSTQMGMVRTLYLRSILVNQNDLTPTLSLGQSMDHVISISCAYLGGVVWSIWGPQYLFFLVAALSFVNLYIAKKV